MTKYRRETSKTIAELTGYVVGSETENSFNSFDAVAFKINPSRTIPSLHSVLQPES